MRNPISHRNSRFDRIRIRASLLPCFALFLASAASTSGQIAVTEINPKQATLNLSGPNGASGGRINGLARVNGNHQIFYAASEWGGLYRTNDGGRNWSRLDGHLPTATWDVEVSPADANRVIATSFYDGRVNSLAGINVSTDGGVTWVRHPSATPPANFCKDEDRRNEPSAFGIAFDPANPQNVYVGTNCGLAISHNGGTTWRYVDPTTEDRADDVWDVVVHHGGIVDLCGDDGHRRRATPTGTWTTATGSRILPSGTCSIASSPDESYVLFAVAGIEVFESDDGGANWSTRFTNPSPQGRVPFVTTNQRAGAGFDLWFGDTGLHRASCTTPNPAVSGGSPRCQRSQLWAGGFTTGAGAHDDVGDIVFDPRSTEDACPSLFSSDGGVYFNSRTTSPACHNPSWSQPQVTPRGLWLFALAGSDLAGAESEALYFANQDTGTFATRNAGAATPTWSTIDCCDGFDVSADTSRVVYTVCCYNVAPANRLFVRGVGMTGGGELNTYPDGTIPGWRSVGVVDQFSPNGYALITSSGVFITENISANPVNWSELRAETGNPSGACGVKASGSGTTPVFYVQGENCSGAGDRARWQDRIWRHTGKTPGTNWRQIRPPGGLGGFGIFDVHPTNSNRIIASHITNTAVRMILSEDGGATWRNLTALDTLMSGNGVFKSITQRGPTDFLSFHGYPQPTLVAYDPQNPDIIIAGGADSGLHYTTNGGTTWTTITNNSGGPSNPIIPRPRFAYFDHENGNINVYIGTQGRGAWRIRVPNP